MPKGLDMKCLQLTLFINFLISLDKQFLITRNVACYRRCKQMEYVGEETIVEDGGDGDGWVETHHFDPTTSTEIDDKICEMTLDNSKVVK